MGGSGSKDLRGRRAGLVMPLFSLRSSEDWGVGEIPDLVAFSRWAAEAGFAAVMLLPFHEVWPGETSPYGAVTAFALDPVYLRLSACEDFDALGGEARVLSDEQRARLAACRAAGKVAWNEVRALKSAALGAMFAHFEATAAGTTRAQAFARFCEEEAHWLDDYALYHALATARGPGWSHWPTELRQRDPEALAEARRQHRDRVVFRQYVEWLLTQQWMAAQAQAREMGVEFGGDLPFVVSRDAADVWANQEKFRPELRLGAPPDDFSAEGQDWGLPVYHWEALRQANYGWLRARAARSRRLCSLWRIDHVVGLFRSYYKTEGGESGFLPPDEPSQVIQGKEALEALSGAGDILAEDLGVIPKFVRATLRELKVPGFKVLRWEKDDGIFRDPASWDEVSVATTGTHDTEPQADWWDALPLVEKRAVLRLAKLDESLAESRFSDAVRDALLRLVYASPSQLTLVPFQDALGLRGRVNLPGTVGEENWTYRMPMSLGDLRANEAETRRLAQLARDTGRHA